jgi:outer membrane protein OmpA-like peptidoglycan-associated protein
MNQKRVLVFVAALAALGLVSGVAWAQGPPAAPASSVIARSINALGYSLGGSTTIDLKASGAVPQAAGEAKVEAKQGITNIEVKVKGLVPPTKLGPEFLTYALWAVSQEGQTSNVGELLPNEDGEAELKTTTRLQTFALFVTAEPYFAVRQPSEVLVLENALRKGTKGRIFPIADYKLLKRSQYEKAGNAPAPLLDLKNVPLDLYQARNAVEIARSRGAEKYAPEFFAKADGGLQIAERDLKQKANKKEIVSRARTAVQEAEDARALTVQRQEEERIAAERQAAAASAKADAEAKATAAAAAAKQKADEEARRQAEIAAARETQIKAEAAAAKQKADEDARRQAELSAAREAQVKAEADAAALKAKYEADALKAKEEAAKAEAERAQKASEQLRAQLLDQFNRVLDTRDTPRGLVVNMGDVLFDTGKYDLRPAAREKLARLSGIVLAHPGLKLEVEGHTDSVGTDEINQKLSDQRSSTVRSYLVEQGLAADAVTSKGFGKTMPVADNGTAAGRQKNRRVEIVVSGEVIGTKIGK